MFWLTRANGEVICAYLGYDNMDNKYVPLNSDSFIYHYYVCKSPPWRHLAVPLGFGEFRVSVGWRVCVMTVSIVIGGL